MQPAHSARGHDLEPWCCPGLPTTGSLYPFDVDSEPHSPAAALKEWGPQPGSL